ncbi:HDOD domain-containing protein [Ideonella sp. DXS29W]|uniref:HDOD domain-containing protein n=1 Tax=Ideonella lacteola TaxID=2984193 RepID=A0ABU9BYW5_9BURK
MSSVAGTHAILEHVILGCGALFDARRAPMSTRLTVHPATDEVKPDPDGLLAMLADVWPADCGPMSLNLTSEGWLSALMEITPPTHLMIEVPAFLAADAAWEQRIRARAADGVAMVLKGRPLSPLPADLMSCFKLAIVDRADDRRLANNPPPGGAVRTVPFVQSGNANPAEAGDSFKRGAHAVLGWPLGDPPDGSKPKKGVPGSVQVVMDLIQRVEREEPAAKLEAVLRGDPSLAFRLMRYINSPGFGLSVEINSFSHALMMLGYGRLKRWLALLMTSAIDDPDLKPMMFLAVRRGLFMEELARAHGDETTRNEVFLCGVFSLLDRMLGQTFGQLLGSLPVPERVAQALVHSEGPYRPYLELAIAVEMESPIDIREHTEAMLLTPGEVNRAALKAMGTARQLRAD